jgi:hypothetical protein
VLDSWYQQPQRTLDSLLTALRKGIKPALLAIGVPFVAWVVLFSWAIYKSLYNDHENLAGRLRDVVNEKNALKTSLADRDKRIAQLMTEKEGRTSQVQKSPAVPVVHHESSLRDRANKLANELQSFNDDRDKHMPGYSESGPLTFEQRQAIEAPYNAYRQQTYKLYEERFSVRVVTIVQEFKALGVDVSQIENCAAAGLCPTMPIPIQLHALAARLDDNGNVRR